ncbi:MAG: methionine adenosyltransferase domain-containing protein [Candidatus Nanosyncoccaceae bacterium]|jgi:S-adenosylmethionine synthetase
MKDEQLRTAESVSPKHPDKMCDQISDAILDAYLTQDPQSRVAVEVMGGHGKIFIIGEVTSRAHVEVEPIVRRIAGEMEIEARLAEQSPEIAGGVNTGGAGDQGIMIGYATKETPEMLPLEVVLSRQLNQFLYDNWPYDGKTQVTIRGQEIQSVVASWQKVAKADLEVAVKQWLNLQSHKTKELHINPAGDWQIGGFEADTGLTGRKLVVDNYGPRIPVGGGAFSGKDATKVDRSAAYMARKIAVDYLQKFQANEVLVRLAYAIGYDQPVEATVIVDGAVQEIQGYDLSPQGIINLLDLRKPVFEATARYGHFGHKEFTWER